MTRVSQTGLPLGVLIEVRVREQMVVNINQTYDAEMVYHAALRVMQALAEGVGQDPAEVVASVVALGIETGSYTEKELQRALSERLQEMRGS